MYNVLYLKDQTYKQKIQIVQITGIVKYFSDKILKRIYKRRTAINNTW